MTVSTRNTLLVSAGLFSAALVGGIAYAGGGNGGGNGPAPIPGAGMGGTNMNQGGGNGSGHGHCCKGPKGPSVIVPGVNVSGPNVMITGSNVSVHQGSYYSSTQSFISTSIVGSGESSVVVSGGGGFYAPQGVGATAIGELHVEGGEETITETEEYCEDQISIQTIVRPVQAVCVDDRGVPHPASQVDASDRVPEGYQGELFRCMAGTSMQVTLGSVENGSASFAHGETFACQKGEALVHHRDGRLTCAPQTPERSCNERSLLRRHGAGIKLIQSRVEARTCIPRTRTVTKTVEREAGGQAMVFDGGVGQGVY